MNRPRKSWSTSLGLTPQARERSLPVSIWWPGLKPWCSVGNSLKELHGAIALHLPPAEVQVGFKPGGWHRWGPRPSYPWHCRLVLPTWNVPSLAEKEPELVWEEEAVLTNIVGLTSTHSAGSGTKRLETEHHFVGVLPGK